ncbi:MAG: glycoside hydrolase family 1 protein [Bacteroidetes bacterium]|nr:glycoside hydrolase family 1 protein [Bacteroidota bacterium]
MTTPQRFPAYSFPKGFLWGTATSAHQVEGHNTRNNWHQWEQEHGRILDGSTSGRACGWWEGHWREDLDRAAVAGQNAHRCSLEWSRLQPAPETWDDDAIAFYRALLEGMHARGLCPLVTLHHYTDPQWFADEGGWLGRRAVQRFRAYATGVIERFGDLCVDWCTFNEPNALVLQSYVGGYYPPGKRNILLALCAAVHIARAHTTAFEVIHHIAPEARVGIVVLHYDIQPLYPQRKGNVRLIGMIARLVNDFFADAVIRGQFPAFLPFPSRDLRPGALDFYGLNYYTGVELGWTPWRKRHLGFSFRYPPEAPRSPSGLVAHYPEGFRRVLDHVAGYGVPVIITENGIDDADDRLRPRYIVEHLREAAAAISRGMRIEGYFHWSLVDNFEWEKGWTHHFGLWEMDPETLVRRERASARLYADICHANGFTDGIAHEHEAMLRVAE